MIDNYFKVSPWFTQILTIVHRRQNYFSAEARKHYKGVYDYIACYYMMRAGKCALFKDKMGVYRKQSSGVFSGTNETKWKELAFTQDMTLYHLEKEKRVIPNINYFMVELVKVYAKHFQFGKAVKLLWRYLTGIKPTHLCEVFSSRISKAFRWSTK